jgi:hypothetical protein
MTAFGNIHFLDTGFTPASVRARMADQAANAGNEALAARCMR